MDTALGFSHFLAQSDGLIRFVLGVLLVMSVACWYLMFSKALGNRRARMRTEAFLSRFWDASSLAEFRTMLDSDGGGHAFATLASQALRASRDEESNGVRKLTAAGGIGEYLTRVLRSGIEQEATRAESGLSLLASTGSVAPYVGLFGTVWGIYHALLRIGLSGQGTLDKVAGPVGEALIMTGLGLAVAIPAVLAYNAFNRWNRVWLGRLDAFAHDLYTLVTVGEKLNSSAGVARALRVVATSA